MICSPADLPAVKNLRWQEVVLNFHSSHCKISLLLPYKYLINIAKMHSCAFYCVLFQFCCPFLLDIIPNKE